MVGVGIYPDFYFVDFDLCCISVFLIMKNVLEIQNLNKTFGKFVAVDNVSFSLQEGEILGLLGPNGAGNTTIIQMLLGILKETSGRISYFGKEFWSNREEILDRVNFSSTYTNFPWNLTVKEVLTFISYLYKISDRKKRIEEIVELFNLQEFYYLTVAALSAGQQTRLNLAKAFLNRPAVLLLDEPTASLDPDVADYIRKFLLEERKSVHTSVLFTSHNMREVEEVCDRVVVIQNGRLIANDTPYNLARTIDVCHIELLIRDGLKRAIQYSQSLSLHYEIEGRYIVVDVKEKDIPDFLRSLMDQGVQYDEISIEKPDLEDYFLRVASQKKEAKSLKI